MIKGKICEKTMIKEKISVLAKHLQIEKELIQLQEGDTGKWFETLIGTSFRVLTNEERKEEALQEIKECCWKWSYTPKELSQATNQSIEVFLPYLNQFGINGTHIELYKNDEVQELIEKTCGEEHFFNYLLDHFTESGLIGELLNKVDEKEYKDGDLYVYPGTNKRRKREKINRVMQYL